MKILAIDLTSASGSLAVRIDGQTAATLALHSTEGFEHLVYPAVEQVLQAAKVGLKEIDCFAGASGPGAFTGVRVGLTVVKGLAFALEKLVCGVSNLRALSVLGTKPRRAVLLDARRGDIFGAVYDQDARVLVPETVMKFSAWLESLPRADYEFITGSELPGTEHFLRAPKLLADAVAACAEQDAAQGKLLDTAALDANYVRRSDAEMFWRE